MDFYGALLPEANADLRNYTGECPLEFHGPVSQSALAEAFRNSSLLVLPSLEEGFGLVVPQALSCGVPCVVSDRVGAKDLIEHRVNCSIFATEDAESLSREIIWWERNRVRPEASFPWLDTARQLMVFSGNAL